MVLAPRLLLLNLFTQDDINNPRDLLLKKELILDILPSAEDEKNRSRVNKGVNFTSCLGEIK